MRRLIAGAMAFTGGRDATPAQAQVFFSPMAGRRSARHPDEFDGLVDVLSKAAGFEVELGYT
jgi:hypothetical protein